MRLRDLLRREGKDHFYIMHLSYDGDEKERLWNYARYHKVIGLSNRHVRDDWTKVNIATRKVLNKGWIRQFDDFCEMAKGEIVMVLNGMVSILGVAETIESKHHYDRSLDEFFDHTRKVKWLRELAFSKAKRLPRTLEGFSNTLSKVPSSSPRWDMLTSIDI